MSDPQGRGSRLQVGEAPLKPSSDAAELQSVSAEYFEAWLENVKPSLDPKQNQIEPLTAAAEPAPGECRLEGRFEGTLRVDGYLTGFPHSLTGTLIIGEAGEAACDLDAATVIVEGTVCGNIHATERVALGSHARVFGNIKSAAISIAPGAVFEGECHFLLSRFKPDSKGIGGTRSSVRTLSGMVSSDSPNPTEAASEEEAEPLAVAFGH